MLEFTKWEGLGNDFIVTEADWNSFKDPSSMAQTVCHRNFGIGADGLVFLTQQNSASGPALGMKIWNADGSLAKMCGNALRCLGARAYQLGWLATDQWISFETDSGPRSLRLVAPPARPDAFSLAADDQPWVEVDMGLPILAQHETLFSFASATCAQDVVLFPVDMGNPHVVIDGSQLDRAEWHHCSALLQTSSLAIDGGVNVEWWSANADGSLEVWVYERGVGPTLACGTGACAVYAQMAQSLQLSGWVHLPGGWLKMRLEGQRIFMNGPARRVFSGQLDWSFEQL